KVARSSRKAAICRTVAAKRSHSGGLYRDENLRPHVVDVAQSMAYSGCRRCGYRAVATRSLIRARMPLELAASAFATVLSNITVRVARASIEELKRDPRLIRKPS